MPGVKRERISSKVRQQAGKRSQRCSCAPRRESGRRIAHQPPADGNRKDDEQRGLFGHMCQALQEHNQKNEAGFSPPAVRGLVARGDPQGKSKKHGLPGFTFGEGIEIFDDRPATNKSQSRQKGLEAAFSQVFYQAHQTPGSNEQDHRVNQKEPERARAKENINHSKRKPVDRAEPTIVCITGNEKFPLNSPWEVNREFPSSKELKCDENRRGSIRRTSQEQGETESQLAWPAKCKQRTRITACYAIFPEQ